jgi:hypothetical protein
MNSRIKIHYRALCEILNKNSSSFYRFKLQKIVNTKKRHKFECLNIAITDYYESRKERVFFGHIMTEFESKLRQKAIIDRLMRDADMTKFVLVVLVLELTTMLIMNDMKISKKNVKNILNANAQLENILQKDVDF